MKNKKIISVLVLVLVLLGAYFVKNNFIKKVAPADLSSSLLADQNLPFTYNINYVKKIGPVTPKTCNGKEYKPIIKNNSNIIGPYPHSVKITFNGTIDDNLKINGVIVDAKNALQKGSNCSHRHSLSYSQIIPANKPIDISIIDQHGGDAAMSGTLKVEKYPVEQVKLTLEQLVSGGYLTAETRGSGVMVTKSGKYTKDELLKIEATPASGSMVAWESPCQQSGNTCTVKMDSDKTIRYAFVKKKTFWQKCKISVTPKEIKLECIWE